MDHGVPANGHSVSDDCWIDLVRDMDCRHLAKAKIVSNANEMSIGTNDRTRSEQ